MIYPKIIILAIGGSHGDFLINCCRIMQGEEIKKRITITGQAEFRNEFKHKTQFRFKKGKKQNLELDKINDVELSHIWYDDFQKYPSEFFYIGFAKEILPVILKMYLTKVCNNNLQQAVNKLNYFIPEELGRKINAQNISKILPVLWWNAQIKYQQQKDIKRIELTDLYDYDKLLKILQQLGVYNKSLEKELKEYHTEWLQKNSVYIDEIEALEKTHRQKTK